MAFILNLPYTILGLLIAAMLVPKSISWNKNPAAVIVHVRNYNFGFGYMKGWRAMAVGHTVILNPKVEDRDLEHELIHVEQSIRSPLIQPILYFVELIQKGYKENRYEQEAYLYAGNDFKEQLSPEVLMKKTSRSLDRLGKYSFEEGHAYFMANVQIIEQALKNMLVTRYGYEENETERFPLSRCIKELRKVGLRKDFIQVLKDLNEDRDYIAHEILADELRLRALMGPNTGRLNRKYLERGMRKAQQAIHIFDFLFVENKFFCDGRDENGIPKQEA